MTTIRRPSGSGTGGSGLPGWVPGPSIGPADAPASGALITIVLDKSGSMEIVRDATIDGFNSFTAQQRAAGGDALVSLTVFDSDVHEICAAVPLREVTVLGREAYVPDGTTALYDAIGTAIRRTDEMLASQAARPDRILLAVITDGEENASREFTREQIFDLVREHERAGWTFVFLGANIDSYAASQTVGVQGAARSRDWIPTDEEMRRNMVILSNATARWRDEQAVCARESTRSFFNADELGCDSDEE